MSKAVDYVNNRVEWTVNQDGSWRDKVIATIFESGYLNPHEVAELFALILEDLATPTNSKSKRIRAD